MSRGAYPEIVESDPPGIDNVYFIHRNFLVERQPSQFGNPPGLTIPREALLAHLIS